MVYASEPDIRFEKEASDGSWKEIATIKVKGSTDPVGALERLGAVKKSFDRTSDDVFYKRKPLPIAA